MTNNAKLHDQPLAFDQQQTHEIDHCLLRLADRIAAPLVMLSDVSGRLILYRGRLSSSQSTGLAALASAGFAAGTEIANFLGLRNSFQQQLLEGNLANLYLLTIGPELLLIVAFTRQTTLGMVRLFAQQAQQELLVLVEAAKITRETTEQEMSDHLDDAFNDELKQQLDELFTDDF
jgi:predicted regulator of Ras-like GTPase activity (Roadblock/LC7/MglB family)